MGADIVNIVDGKFSGRSFIHLPAGDWVDLRAEIVRLRGEVALAAGWHDEAPAMPNGVEEMVAYLDNWLSREHGLNLGRVKVGDAVDAALSAAGNRDAAGVEGNGPDLYSGPHAPCIHPKITPAVVPAGEAVAWIRDNLPESLHGMGVVDVLQLLLDGGIAAEKDLIDAESPQPADGEAVEFVAVPDDYRNQASGYRAGWTDAMNAAPVQAAPQEGEAPHGHIRWLDDGYEIDWLRDWTGGDCDLYLAAHPSACELVVDASKMLRGRVRPGAAFGVAVIDVDCSDFGPNTIGDGHEILIHNLTKNPIAALQHRGDSRGGEVGS